MSQTCEQTTRGLGDLLLFNMYKAVGPQGGRMHDEFLMGNEAIALGALAAGVNVVQMGSIATSLMKKVIANSVDRNDPEELALLEAIKGVKRFTVIEYGDCDENTRNRLVRRLGRALPDEDVLMDIKDSGQQSMRLYGVVSDDGKTLKDFVLHSPEGSALICLFGTISLDGVSKFIEER